MEQKKYLLIAAGMATNIATALFFAIYFTHPLSIALFTFIKLYSSINNSTVYAAFGGVTASRHSYKMHSDLPLFSVMRKNCWVQFMELLISALQYDRLFMQPSISSNLYSDTHRQSWERASTSNWTKLPYTLCFTRHFHSHALGLSHFCHLSLVSYRNQASKRRSKKCSRHMWGSWPIISCRM